jgi:hypothetical protein
MLRKWRIWYSTGEIVELFRVRRPSRFARAMADEGATFSIELIG